MNYTSLDSRFEISISVKVVFRWSSRPFCVAMPSDFVPLIFYMIGTGRPVGQQFY